MAAPGAIHLSQVKGISISIVVGGKQKTFTMDSIAVNVFYVNGEIFGGIPFLPCSAANGI
jgi:hypothetical protein